MVKERDRTLSETTAVFTISILLTLLTGWVCLYFSRLLITGEYFIPLAWSLSLALSGFSFFLCLSADNTSLLKRKLRSSCILIYLVQFVMSLAWLFIHGRYNLYTLGFVWASITAAMIAVYIILTIRFRIFSGMLLLLPLALLCYSAHLSLIAAL